MSGWLDRHITGFVEPVVGPVDSCPGQPSYFHQVEMAYIKNAWRAVKHAAGGEPVILPGRDVFVFEVLARREGYPTVFLPQCSRLTVQAVELSDEQKSLLVLDTGFIGTIPQNLGTKRFKLFSANNKSHQVFPNFLAARSIALKIEKTPKYWETARIVDGKIVQMFSGADEFVAAAHLTMEVYKDSSPRMFRRVRCH